MAVKERRRAREQWSALVTAAAGALQLGDVASTTRLALVAPGVER